MIIIRYFVDSVILLKTKYFEHIEVQDARHRLFLGKLKQHDCHLGFKKSFLSVEAK